MPRTHILQEVAVLHFFEDAPWEKADAVFNIVAQKMRERRSVTMTDARTIPKQRSKRTMSDPGDGAPGLNADSS